MKPKRVYIVIESDGRICPRCYGDVSRGQYYARDTKEGVATIHNNDISAIDEVIIFTEDE